MATVFSLDSRPCVRDRLGVGRVGCESGDKGRSPVTLLVVAGSGRKRGIDRCSAGRDGPAGWPVVNQFDVTARMQLLLGCDGV